MFVLNESTREESGRKIEPKAGHGQTHTAMPSVEMMRRSTRVFGMGKGVDVGRVLRSGRRLWSEPGEAKLRRSNDVDDCYLITKKPQKSDKVGATPRNVKTIVVIDEVPVKRHSEMKVEPQKKVDKMYGLVYTRKRKRTRNGFGNFFTAFQDKKYGLQFSRRQRRRTKNYHSDKSMGLSWKGVSVHSEVSPVFCFLVSDGSSCGWNWWFSCFLYLILEYLKRENLRLSELAAFLMSRPIYGAFSSSGLEIQMGPVAGPGVCKFFGSGRFSPMFSLDFNALPRYFTYMHHSILLPLKCLRYDPVNDFTDEDSDDDMIIDETPQICMPLHGICKIIAPDMVNSENKSVLHPSIGVSKVVTRNQYKVSLSSRGIQKRRSSLRRRSRGRIPSLGGVHKASGVLLSDLLSSRRNGIPFSSVVSKNKLRSSVRSNSGAILQELNSTTVESPKDVDTSCCSASLLVIETDRCYREEAVLVSLESTASKEWLIVVKKDGLIKHKHKAQKLMRPCASNRFTHDIIWTGDDNWKLEFPNRHDWIVFKELYKQCVDRNASVSAGKVIPVPGVREVLGFQDSLPYRRPDSYISVKTDEVSRAMAKRTANYDMDSEDEEWLKNFNNEKISAGSDLIDDLSEDRFELMIDAFEKAYFCSPEDYTDENAAMNLCLDLGKKDVVEAVYNYWSEKRKQKRSALLRVFQSYQARKAPLVPKPVLRKRRSFKRQASHGRGKQPSVLQAMAAEQDAAEEESVLRNVEAARVSANKSVELALEKRKRAQLLMENADLATYKAMVALRIAEAARIADNEFPEAPDAAEAILSTNE